MDTSAIIASIVNSLAITFALVMISFLWRKYHVYTLANSHSQVDMPVAVKRQYIYRILCFVGALASRSFHFAEMVSLQLNQQSSRMTALFGGLYGIFGYLHSYLLMKLCIHRYIRLHMVITRSKEHWILWFIDYFVVLLMSLSIVYSVFQIVDTHQQVRFLSLTVNYVLTSCQISALILCLIVEATLHCRIITRALSALRETSRLEYGPSKLFSVTNMQTESIPLSDMLCIDSLVPTSTGQPIVTRSQRAPLDILKTREKQRLILLLATSLSIDAILLSTYFGIIFVHKVLYRVLAIF